MRSDFADRPSLRTFSLPESIARRTVLGDTANFLAASLTVNSVSTVNALDIMLWACHF